jgi:eukaryotic-like serine/threonine-protein kinase
MAIVKIQKFGKYEILDELGRGGMGVVYKARDPIIGRLVALKTLVAGSAADPDLLKRFYREAQAAGRLQHPNIITIFDMGEADGTPYIAMQFLEGETLERAIAGRQPLSVPQKLSIILQLCKGLDFAHKNGVVHRDVKPANIFLGNDGIVRVLDFGIVHIAATTMTHTGMVIGTVPYMSPEQVTGQHVDQRSDIFSVGTVSYEFLTWAKPFDGPNLPSIMYKIVNERPTLPSSLASDIPPVLDQAIMRCLEQRLENRYQSLEDFVQEMEPIEQSLKRQMIGNLVGQGQDLYQRKEYSKAKEVLRDVLMLDSSHGMAKELMAKVSAELRQAEVVARVERLVDDGNRLLKQGTPTEAVRVLEEALKLDAGHDYARQLLSEAQERVEREKLLRQGLAAIHNALGKGNLTVAEAELGKVLQLDAGNHEAQVFQERIKQARAHERRLRIQQAVLFPRHLLVQERYEEAIQQLDQLAQEFPGEAEIVELLQTARSKYQEQQKRRQIEAQVGLAKGLIADQRFEEAVDLLDKLRAESPSPDVAALHESARHSLELALREQQLEREMASVQELIRQEHYEAAVERAQALHRHYPESDEARRLEEFAKSLKQTAEQQREAADLCRRIQSLLDAGQFDDAIRMAETGLTRFPDNRALASVLSTAQERKAKAAAQLEEERLRQRIASEITAVEQVLAAKDYAAALQRAEALEKQYPHRTEIRRLLDLVRTTVRAEERRRIAVACQTIKALLDSGDVDRALQEADQALHEFPGNADVTALWMTAQREIKARAA